MKEPVEFNKGCYVGTKTSEFVFAHILTSETIFPEGYMSDWHYHQNPHYSHILHGGSKELRQGDYQLQKEGDGLYYYPGIAHQNIQYRPSTRIFNIEIEEAFFRNHDLGIPAEAQMFSDKLKVNTAGLLKILKEHYWQDQYSRIAVEQLSVELIAASPAVHKHYPEWTNKITEALNDRWDEPWSLKELSDLVDIHPVTLSKYFSKYFNCNLGNYIRRLKVDKALKLIRSNRFSLTEVAYRCGFTDQAHFTKTFFLFTGMLPKHYKNI